MSDQKITTESGISVTLVKSTYDGRELISLCVGDAVTRKTLDDMIAEEIKPLDKRRAELEEVYTPLFRKRLAEVSPEYAETGKYPDSEITSQVHEYLDKTEIGKQLSKAKKALKTTRGRRYTFERVKDDLPVGTQAVLVFEKHESSYLTTRLRKEAYSEGMARAVEQEETVGYIVQIEVLRPYRRQGIAKELVKTAVKMLEDEGVKTTYGTVEDNNIDGPDMMVLLMRQGFDILNAQPMMGGGYTLMLKRKGSE